MEELKRVEELTKIDQRHMSATAFSSEPPCLEKMYQFLSHETLTPNVPNSIKSQFNTIKNMALYSFYYYALSSEVQLKSYAIIEHALRIKIRPKKPMTLKSLINHAITQGWISDQGFRNVGKACPENTWCKSMAQLIPSLRNLQTHETSLLTGDCLKTISICADFLNQLFPTTNNTNSTQKFHLLKPQIHQ